MLIQWWRVQEKKEQLQQALLEIMAVTKQQKQQKQQAERDQKDLVKRPAHAEGLLAKATDEFQDKKCHIKASTWERHTGHQPKPSLKSWHCHEQLKEADCKY